MPIPDPYTLTITVAIAWASLAALRSVRDRPPGPTDAVVWLLLWIPFDLRWFNAMWPGRTHALSYGVWAVFVTALGLWGWGRARGWEGLGRARPRWRDAGIAALALLGILVLVLPPGLAIGFVGWAPRPPAALEGVLRFVLIAVTIALPEELYFRGVLQSMLERRLGRPALALALASAAFGLMHWNNTETLAEALSYCGLATVAGAVYGAAYRAGGSLWPAVLCHTAVDWLWVVLFRG